VYRTYDAVIDGNLPSIGAKPSSLKIGKVCNIITDCYLRTSEEKKFKKNDFEFFSNSAFLLFFKIFYTYDAISRLVFQIFEKFKLLCASGTWG
jgi:hypothetical protein